MSFADQSRGLLAANPAGTMGQITTPPMIRSLILILALVSYRLPVFATVNPAQEAQADSWCLQHGCGDLPPMDDL